MTGQHQKKRLNASERRALLIEQGVITVEEGRLLSLADENGVGRPIENAVGVMAIPVGIAEHFVVNGREIAGVPMATEELSIVAAASKAAKLARPLGGFTVTAPLHATVQGHLLYACSSAKTAEQLQEQILANELEFAHQLRRQDPLEKHGGGILQLSTERIVYQGRTFVIIRIRMNPAEAMGANAVTRVGIRLSDMIKKVCGVDAVGTICTNHQSGWCVEAMASWSCESIGANRLQRILDWDAFANADIDRAVTNNKGIMNGVTAVALATSQDTRAIEACVHAAAVADGQYQPLASYWVDEEKNVLNGELQLTLPVATKGGKTDHPQALIYRKIMGASTAKELACIMAAVGLAQNFGALYCLAGEGIPAAHVALAKAR